MTDKFVVSTNEIGEIIVTDVETDRVYRYDDPSNFFGLIRLLNEQQATIQSLQDQLQDYKEIKDNWDSMVAKATEVSLRNVELVEENARLRIENKKLKEEEKLYAQEILRLNELLKQYQSFKDLGGDY